MAVTLEEPTAAEPVVSVDERDGNSEQAEISGPAVSVLIVTWNSGAWVERCLASLPDAFAGMPYEVVVHDNASLDDTVQFARAAAGSRTTITASKENSGFAGGLNRALPLAKGKYVLCLNPDCQPVPGSLRELVDYLESHPEVSGAVPLLVDEQGVPQRRFQLRRLPTVSSLAAEILLLDRVLPENRLTSRYRYRDLDITVPQEIEQPAAAAIMLRRSVIDEIGLFDERFAPAWFEDVDYSKRLSEAGHSIRLIPSATAKHRGGASLDHVAFDDFLRVWYRNLFLYARKWFPAGRVELLRWAIIAGMFLRAGASLAGLSRLANGRNVLPRTYMRIARDAFRRWESDIG